MEYFYRYARLPDDRELVTAIDTAAAELAADIRDLDLSSLDISDYNRTYLRSYLRQLRNTMQRYAYILAWSLAAAPARREELTFLDYGAGVGMLALLAKRIGVGTVIYNDIYDVSCTDAETIARALSARADHYVLGDIDDVLAFRAERGLSCDVVASFDVIEHVYDVEDLLAKLPKLSDGAMTVLMATSANACNPLTRRKLMKLHRQVEHRDRERQPGHKERDGLRAWRTVRREIIRTHAADLGDDVVEHLIGATRGMIEDDIRRCVDSFLASGQMPPPPSHPTNTCDPHTGNWTEHLMDPRWVLALLREGRFDAELLPGYYGHMVSRPKRWIGTALNLLVRATGRFGPRAALYLMFLGRRGTPAAR